jgi:outer membrane protein OmpA-like peptidoglycan-associated protein
MRYLLTVVCAGLLAGCATSVPPTELIDARQAYSHASVGQAAQLVPAELEKALVALVAAEKSFHDSPGSLRTRDLAYVADRKAKIAEALAATLASNATTAKANKDFAATQTKMARDAKPEHGPALAYAVLAKYVVVKKGVRGLVIPLSDSTLFTSDGFDLLQGGQDRLNRITTALLEINGQKLTVECYTDAWRPSRETQQMSQRRADAVRSYIILRGYPGALIQARGIDDPQSGERDMGTRGQVDRPRVEIIIDYAAR